MFETVKMAQRTNEELRRCFVCDFIAPMSKWDNKNGVCKVCHGMMPHNEHNMKDRDLKILHSLTNGEADASHGLPRR